MFNLFKCIIYILLDIINNVYKDIKYAIEGLFDIAGHYKSALMIILGLTILTWWQKQYDKAYTLITVYIILYLIKIIQAGKWKDNLRRKEIEKLKKQKYQSYNE